MGLKIPFAQLNVFKIQMTDDRKYTTYSLLEKESVCDTTVPSLSRRMFVFDLTLSFCIYFHALAHFILQKIIIHALR